MKTSKTPKELKSLIAEWNKEIAKNDKLVSNLWKDIGDIEEDISRLDENSDRLYYKIRDAKELLANMKGKKS